MDERKNVLFLLRTYNDIDHIAPVIWKATVSGWLTFILFVDGDFSDDYRIRFLSNQGACISKSKAIEWYHSHLRQLLFPRAVRGMCDLFVTYSFGLFWLRRYKIEVIVNEWCGPYGRARADHFLRAADVARIPAYSLPHGYYLWENDLFSRSLADHFQEHGRFPDFSNRNWFTRYVVQSSEHKVTNVKYGMDSDKILVLGSARFCKEWSTINLRLLTVGTQTEIKKNCYTVVFFLPHWDYNVYREQCIKLLLRIARLSDVRLVVKAHTRGSGALSHEEKNLLRGEADVVFADDSKHSVELIQEADLVINFGSSIGFEALRQGKPVVNTVYLHDNQTFFDCSDAVIDAYDEESTLQCIVGFQFGWDSAPEQLKIDEFLINRVEGGSRGQDVLQSYLDLLSGAGLDLQD